MGIVVVSMQVKSSMVGARTGLTHGVESRYMRGQLKSLVPVEAHQSAEATKQKLFQKQLCNRDIFSLEEQNTTCCVAVF
jgi:hypothetical protein